MTHPLDRVHSALADASNALDDIDVSECSSQLQLRFSHMNDAIDRAAYLVCEELEKDRREHEK